MNGAGVLVVGYGNTLRSDDGIGWHAAGLLAADPRLAGADVLACHQLVPELATDIRRASLVVLVDAAADGDPGTVSVRRVRPRSPRPASWSHHLDPEALAGLAEALYGAVPPIALVRVAAGSFAEGDRLSKALERALPRVVEVVVGVVTCARPPAEPGRTAGPGTGR
jgi:hydrogenase maturation protease